MSEAVLIFDFVCCNLSARAQHIFFSGAENLVGYAPIVIHTCLNWCKIIPLYPLTRSAWFTGKIQESFGGGGAVLSAVQAGVGAVPCEPRTVSEEAP